MIVEDAELLEQFLELELESVLCEFFASRNTHQIDARVFYPRDPVSTKPRPSRKPALQRSKKKQKVAWFALEDYVIYEVPADPNEDDILIANVDPRAGWVNDVRMAE